LKTQFLKFSKFEKFLKIFKIFEIFDFLKNFDTEKSIFEGGPISYWVFTSFF